MALFTFIASQLRKPSGFIGKSLVSRLLNRGNAPLNQLTLTLLELKRDDEVIEVGFGGGDLINRMVPQIAEGRIVGVDFSPEMVALCTHRFAPLLRTGQVELRCGSVESLPYEAERFTKACTVNTLYFWPDPRVALTELWRVLRREGRLVLCFNPPATLRKVPYTKYGFSFYEPDQVRQLMQSVGFEDIRMASGTSRLGDFLCAVGTKGSA
jgi:SAM-dependent methyltransferase